MSDQEHIFREKSLEQLSTPEQLTGYLRVAGSGVWFVLAGIILLLAGLLVWGMFGWVYTTVKVPAQVSGGQVSCYVLVEDLTSPEKSVEVAIGDLHMRANTENVESRVMDNSADPALYASGYLTPGKNVLILTCPMNLEDGYYDAVITTEALNPVSLLFSKS